MTPPGPLLASIYGLYLLAVITPGPNTFIVTRLALSASRRHAARAVLGIALGNTAWLCVILGGVAVLLQQVPGAMRAVRSVGEERQPFRSGLFASLSNPAGSRSSAGCSHWCWWFTGFGCWSQGSVEWRTERSGGGAWRRGLAERLAARSGPLAPSAC